jgi:hypothetical protein
VGCTGFARFRRGREGTRGLKQRELRDAAEGHTRPPELKELEARTLVRLPQVALLGGYAPAAAIAVGEHYDARFLDDGLVLCECGDWKR